MCQTGWRLREKTIRRDTLGSMEAVLELEISGLSQPSFQTTRNRLKHMKIGILFKLELIVNFGLNKVRTKNHTM